MAVRVVARYLGIVLLIIGGSMGLSVPWGFPGAGEAREIEAAGLTGLGGAMLLALGAGTALVLWGRSTHHLLRKEAIAVVGLSWIAATLIGAVPFLLSGALVEGNSHSVGNTLVDAIFESASGFTGTGSTIITDLDQIPRCILFWRQQSHFLGGLGIMVLFVAILGHGSPGRMLMRAEMAGPVKQTPHARIRHTAWAFTGIYLGLNAVLTILYLFYGMSLYDALSHSFATIATGGFSTYNDSMAHFDNPLIEMTTTVFMVLACTNFMLLFFLVLGDPRPLLRDVEWRTYLAILAAGVAAVMFVGLNNGDFDGPLQAFRQTVFQVTSIQTNTGLATADFDRWDETSQAVLLLLMFVGGCAGSTSCAIKVIRYCLMAKIVQFEIERQFRPQRVQTLRLGKEPIQIEAVERVVPMYFAMFGAICVVGWMALLASEPDHIWEDAGYSVSQKPLDCASAVAACINGVGPGLGIVGPTQTFAPLSWRAKLVLMALMLLGRLELYAILVLFVPGFWRVA